LAPVQLRERARQADRSLRDLRRAPQLHVVAPLLPTLLGGTTRFGPPVARPNLTERKTDVKKLAYGLQA
jgi:hypothetical protein